MQDVLAQPDGIALAALGKLDDLFGDRIRFSLIAILHPKRAAHVRIGACHRGNRFGFEGSISE
ncbi:MAG: hypothetical protein ACLP19_02140 [Xanthobacteraceae bacterium]